MTTRLFVAIPLPKTTKSELSDCQNTLRVDAKFVEKENLHITVQFLWSKGESEFAEIAKTLSETAKQTPPFTLMPAEVKATPQGKPRLIAVWLADSEHYQAIVEAAKPFVNRPLKRRQLPHITLARIREKSRGVAIAIPKFSLEPIRVDRVTLVASTLTREGPIYKTIKSFSLTG